MLDPLEVPRKPLRPHTPAQDRLTRYLALLSFYHDCPLFSTGPGAKMLLESMHREAEAEKERLAKIST